MGYLTASFAIVLLNLSATPATGINGLALATDLKIETVAGFAARVANAGDFLSAADPIPDFFQQCLVVGVEAHVAVSVIDDHQ